MENENINVKCIFNIFLVFLDFELSKFFWYYYRTWAKEFGPSEWNHHKCKNEVEKWRICQLFRHGMWCEFFIFSSKNYFWIFLIFFVQELSLITYYY